MNGPHILASEDRASPNGDAKKVSYIVSEAKSDIDFRRIVGKIWPDRWAIMGLGILGAIALLSLTFVLPPSYTLEMIVVPTGNETGPANMTLRALGALQQTPEEARFEKFKVVLTSGELATVLIKNPYIMHNIYSAEWSDKKQSWHPAGGWLMESYYAVRRLVGLPGWQAPSAERLHEYIQKRVGVLPDRETGFTTISFSNRDPFFAQRFLFQIYQNSDGILRKAERERLDQSIAYIKRRLDAVSVADYRLRLLEILEDLEKRRMLVNSDTPFSADVLDPPLIPPSPTFPRPAVFMLVGLLLGLMLGCFLAYVSPVGIRLSDIWRPVRAMTERRRKQENFGLR